MGAAVLSIHGPLSRGRVQKAFKVSYRFGQPCAHCIMMTSSCILLLTLALTATLGWTQATLPLCAENCAISSAVEAGCNIEDLTCLCTNTAYISDVESCVAIACTTADQQEAVQYFDQNCDVSTSSSPTSGTASGLTSVTSASLSASAPASVSNTATTAKTTASITKVGVDSTEAAAPTTSSKSITGFNGSLGGFVTSSDVLIIVAVTIVGLTAMTQL